MKSTTGSLRLILTLAAALSVPAVLIVGAIGVPVGAAQATQAMSDRSKVVGTYRLIATEMRGAAGNWARTPDFNAIGYLTYADTGHVAEYTVSRNRPRFTANAPAGEEALAALQGTTAYYGSFTVDDTSKSIVHQHAGHLIPGTVNAKWYYEVDGDRFILTPEPPAGGGKDKATNRVIWERLPNPPLSAEARKFVGFYKLLYTDSYREKSGKEVFHGNRNETQTGSYILYTPSGHMMAHLMQKEGRTKFAGAQPTPDEALRALRSYTGYFGRFTTFENYQPVFVLHNQQGTSNAGREVDATKRFYVFTGNQLRLGAPPTTNAEGEISGGHLYWERLPPIK